MQQGQQSSRFAAGLVLHSVLYVPDLTDISICLSKVLAAVTVISKSPWVDKNVFFIYLKSKNECSLWGSSPGLWSSKPPLKT